MNRKALEERFLVNLLDIVRTIKACNNIITNSERNTIIDLSEFTIKKLLEGVDDQYINPTMIIEAFIKNLTPQMLQQIKDKNDAYFLKNSSSLFASVRLEHIDFVSNIFMVKDSDGNPVIKKSYTDRLWLVVKNLVMISIKYIHLVRIENHKRGISEEYMPNFDILILASEWGVTL